MARKRNDRKGTRQTEARERQLARDLRTTEEQLDELNVRSGLDRDACRERARLYLRSELEELHFEAWEGALDVHS
jgi:hypothetical protein